jgi:P-type Cu2+ transporter
VLNHACQISTAILDGESARKHLQPGAQVHAGAIVLQGDCDYLVQAIGGQTKLAQIAKLSGLAMQARLPSAQRQSRLATQFTLVVLLLALLSALTWSFWQADRALAVSLSVITVACPCALALALPVTRAMAYARLQQSGILLLRANALERLSEIDCLALDKTGTLTHITPTQVSTGKYEPCDVHVNVTGSLDVELAKAIVGAMELGSTHPIASALHWPSTLGVRDLVEHAGAGIDAEVIDPSENNRSLGRWQVASPRFFGLPDRDAIVLKGPLGTAHFVVEEQLVDDAIDAAGRLRNLLPELALLSGDHATRVARIANALGIEQFFARQQPEQKRAWVDAQQSLGKKVMMVGDGINDAIALAAAHLSVSFAHGSPLAHAQSDVLLLNDKLSNLPMMLEIARKSERICRQNLWFSKTYNLLMIPCAMIGWIGPSLAALGMALSSLLVTLNAARLLRESTAVPSAAVRPEKTAVTLTPEKTAVAQGSTKRVIA